MKKMVIVILLLSLILVVGIGGCYSTTSSQQNFTSPSESVQTGGNTVVIKDFAFKPNNINAQPGATITWRNDDSVSHQIVSEGDAAFQGSVMRQGETYSFTFASAGTYNYHCAIHPSMRGAVTVK